MESHDSTTASAIDSLPTELLEIILKGIKHPVDQKRVALVSTRLRDIMRTISRNEFKMRISRHIYSNLAVLLNCKVLPFTRLEICLVDPEKYKETFEFFESFGECISELNILKDSARYPKLLSDLSTFFPNLQVLKLDEDLTADQLQPQHLFHFHRLEILDVSLGKNSTEIVDRLVQASENLKVLRLSDKVSDFDVGTKFVDFLQKWTSKGIKFEFIFFLRDVTPILNAPIENFRIERLKIHLGAPSLLEFFTLKREIGELELSSELSLLTSQAVVEAIAHNEGSIERLILDTELFRTIDLLQETLASSEAIKSVELKVDNRNLPFNQILPEFDRKVRSLRILVSVFRFEGWELVPILEQLHHLEKLDLDNGSVRATMQTSERLIRKAIENGTNLREFIYDIEAIKLPLEGGLSDNVLTGISNMSKLQKLVLMDHIIPFPGAVFAEMKLPTLKELKIKVEELSLEGIKVLAQNIPNVECLELRYKNSRNKKDELQRLVVDSFRYSKNYSISMIV